MKAGDTADRLGRIHPRSPNLADYAEFLFGGIGVPMVCIARRRCRRLGGTDSSDHLPPPASPGLAATRPGRCPSPRLERGEKRAYRLADNQPATRVPMFWIATPVYAPSKAVIYCSAARRISDRSYWLSLGPCRCLAGLLRDTSAKREGVKGILGQTASLSSR